MKYLILVGDGMADFPLPENEGRTPLEIASTPAMDEMAREGILGLFCPIPDDMPPGSDVGNLSLFGYDPRGAYTGRAPFEAANQGIALKPGQIAFRCNLVTLADGRMADFTSGHISSEEAAILIVELNKHLAGKFPVSFSAGVSYRHILIATPQNVSVEELARLACTPPHDITGQSYDGYLPEGAGSDFVRALMDASRPVLDGHPVNKARIAAGKPPATSIWLWGQGLTPAIDSYKDRFGLSGAVISAVDLVKGIGVCAGLEVINVPGATGYLDTDYAGKVAAAIKALERHDFVYVHVEAPDETSHQGQLDLKVQAIAEFDANVVAPCLNFARSRSDVRLVVAPDHVTALSTRTHAHGPVPFVVFGAGVSPNGAHAYSERAAANTQLLISSGHMLMQHTLRDHTLDAAVLTS